MSHIVINFTDVSIGTDDHAFTVEVQVRHCDIEQVLAAAVSLIEGLYRREPDHEHLDRLLSAMLSETPYAANLDRHMSRPLTDQEKYN